MANVTSKEDVGHAGKVALATLLKNWKVIIWNE